MTKIYYHILNPNLECGFERFTEEEFLSMFGNDEIRPYVNQVYRGELNIEEVPQEIREVVTTTVQARIAHFGAYQEQPISLDELTNLIKGIL